MKACKRVVKSKRPKRKGEKKGRLDPRLRKARRAIEKEYREGNMKRIHRRESEKNKKF